MIPSALHRPADRDARTHAPGRRVFEPRRMARRAAAVIVADTAVALMVWLMRGQGFVVGLVYAQCIGLVAWLVIDLGLLRVPRDSSDGWFGGWRVGLLLVAGSVVGAMGGTALAAALLGQPGWAHDLRHPGALLSDVLLTVVFGFVIGAAFFARGRARAQRALLEAAAHQATLARLELLQSQLEPHMLFNTLANLRALIGTRPDAAQAMLDRLIDFLRATLAGSRTSSHPLRDEFARIDDYLALMQVRMGDRLRVHSELPATLADIEVPPLLLQPLVENAIQHGLEPRRGAGELWVRASRDGATLVLRVEDTGLGPAPAASVPRRDGPAGGFGLTQVRERLRTLYGDAATFTLAPREGGGAVAEIRMPIPASASRPAPAATASRP